MAGAVGVTGLAGVAGFGCVGVAGTMVLEGAALEAFHGALMVVGGVLLPVAAAIGGLLARSVIHDLRQLEAGVDAMVRDEAWGRPVPIRSLDEVGEVTRRIDELRRHYLESLDRLREARRRAEVADEDKTEFLTSVSHELRTPLNAVVGFTDVLLAEIDGPLNEGQREDLSIIRGAGSHLVHLFNDVLDLSAAASGHLRLEREPVDVGPIVEAVGAELQGQRQDRPVAIHVELSPDLPAVYGDPHRLRQVITNLASNALKFTEEGEVRLEAEASGGELIVRVRDTGPGIAPDQVPLLFAEFGQVGDAGRRRKGTGLGLAISRKLVELHGGTIEVRSTPGQGSEFTVRLPAGEAR
ncbi:MAG: sensor histidine kinase [Myxococcota bacterium]